MKTPVQSRIDAATHAINSYQQRHPYATLQDQHLAALWADRHFAERLALEEQEPASRFQINKYSYRFFARSNPE